MTRRSREHQVDIDKLVHGGQGIGALEDGKKALVWGVLPGERVLFRETKRRSDYVEGAVTEVVQSSSDRIEPKDELYLSTSPWQIMGYEAENAYKQEILRETIQRAHVPYDDAVTFEAPKNPWQYRNKMEYSFFGDERGLHLALFNRGSHRKQPVTGSSIARAEIDETARSICAILERAHVRAGDLKSLIVRCNQAGETVAALFTRNDTLPKIEQLAGVCKGIVVVFSNPKSPASVRTRDLYSYGDVSLVDSVLGKPIRYDVFSFFQVHIPIFENSLEAMRRALQGSSVVDMYGGVGTIGAALGNVRFVIESDTANTVWAKENVGGEKVITTSSEQALDYIDPQCGLVVDPPRAGLHKDLIDKILEVHPPKVLYLSCNPATQARDLKLLSEGYTIKSISGYNFFPRTPHIESLAFLRRKSL